ncbi:YeiH family protein [Pseudooceanicola nanhaiensis]|uniref:YeiH family protein n=1 Tax=Pseudooceanicola nanhaiensis TaxID=375761 RepID=UPI001CD37A3C|nr:YeiH family protein [Pseudooceanicola nanhaiensis]MCA0922117.1 YeiH family protein [Pseudooceanicola nanhaiensis]
MPILSQTGPVARPDGLRRLLPGLALVLGLALAAMVLQRATGSAALSPMVVAMVAGIALRNLAPLSPALTPGIAFAMRRLLRGGIVLLGFRLTFGQVAEVGLSGLAVIAVTLVATFLFTKAAGRMLGLDRQLSELIAAGTSVCGASAVLAVNTVTRGRDEDVAYAIACVTIFGTLSMLAYPLLAGPLGLDAAAYGLWTGASLHEVAQAVGAGFARGEAAGQVATIAKLSRVILLAPLIFALGAYARAKGQGGGGAAPVPWFVLGFVAAIAVNSLLPLPAVALEGAQGVSTLLLTMALAAMGLETHVGRLRAKGLRPLALGALAWLFVSGLALALVLLSR